jgi:hypothetical protein
MGHHVLTGSDARRAGLFCQAASTAVTGARRASGDRADNAVEIGMRPRIAVDRNMLSDVEFEPLHIVEQRYRIRADGGEIATCGRR